MVAIARDALKVFPFSKNTLEKTALIGISTCFLASPLIATIAMVANLTLSYIFPPSEENSWFTLEHAFKDLTGNKKFWLALGARLLLLFVYTLFVPTASGQFVLERMLDYSSLSELALLLAQACIIAPIIEEILFRGFLQEKIRDIQAALFKSNENTLIHKSIRIIAQASLFGLAHYHPKNSENRLVIVGTGLAGALFGTAKEKTQDLWQPIAMHAGLNASTTCGMLGAEKVRGWLIA